MKYWILIKIYKTAPFSSSFQLLSTKNDEKAYFDQCLECAVVPKNWSKYTIDIIKMVKINKRHQRINLCSFSLSFSSFILSFFAFDLHIKFQTLTLMTSKCHFWHCYLTISFFLSFFFSFLGFSFSFFFRTRLLH